MVNYGWYRYFVSVLIRRISNPSEFTVAKGTVETRFRFARLGCKRLIIVCWCTSTRKFVQEADGGGTEGMLRSQSCNFFENPTVNLLYEIYYPSTSCAKGLEKWHGAPACAGIEAPADRGMRRDPTRCDAWYSAVLRAWYWVCIEF